MFRVVPDQLRISDGWVRCGHCAEVFDASAHLQTQVVAVAPPQPPPTPAADLSTPVQDAAEPPAASVEAASTTPMPTAAAVASPAEAFRAADVKEEMEQRPPMAGTQFTDEPSVPPAAVPPQAWAEPTPEEMRSVIFAAMQRPSADTPASAQAAAAQEPAESSPAQAQPGTQTAALHAAQAEAMPLPMPMPVPLPDATPLPLGDVDVPRTLAAAATAATAEAEAAAPSAPTPAIDDMSFVRAARRKAMWNRPAVRWGMSLLCLLLFVALALQITLQERDRIAAIDARARPWLEQMCIPLGCRVAPLKRIESIVIESSGFNKVRGNAYRLTLSLRNKGTVPLAMPGIELALTDGQDQPVLRRVLLPAEMGASEVLAPGAEWSAALPVSVSLNGASARIAGYRLLAFYP